MLLTKFGVLYVRFQIEVTYASLLLCFLGRYLDNEPLHTLRFLPVFITF